jgi:hypothetical protein
MAWKFMNDPIPAISESEATGSIAEIYADIRCVYRVGVVNLIWRHLATIPGGLPWAWSTIRPLYVNGTVGREAAALRAALSLPELPPWPTAAEGSPIAPDFRPEEGMFAGSLLDHEDGSLQPM